MRVLTWNFERKPPASWQAGIMVDRIAALQPDIVCLTEAYDRSLEALGGSALSTEGVVWSASRPGERKVVLWSRRPWLAVDEVDEAATSAGACLSVLADTESGPVRVIGVCLPYHFASPVGLSPKARPWAQQIRFLEGLGIVLRSFRDSYPTIVLGDYNQYLPRIWGSKAASAALHEAFDGFLFPTSGFAHEGRAAIDHIAHTPDLSSSDRCALSPFTTDRRRLSDHFGVSLDITREEPDRAVRPQRDSAALDLS
jgi:endonuclease/exonuclease/phosphatase family metal-dependent hydrolase